MNYTKKSLSLFLAVLMVLSCWVWVAPANANALSAAIGGEGSLDTPANPEAHYCSAETLVVETEEPATCKTKGVIIEVCSVCGEKKETVIKKLPHTFATTEDGHIICDVCGDPKTVRLTFKNSMGDKEVINAVVADTYTRVASAKVETGAYTYTFIGWYKDGVLYSNSAELEVVAADANETYIAEYFAIKNKYTITYVDSDGKVIASYGYDYGDIVNHKTPADPVKAYDEDAYGNHYDFKEWTADCEGIKDNKVVNSVTYTATFETVKHSLVKMQYDATCATPGGYRFVCACGYSYVIDDGFSLEIPHTVEYVKSETPATIYSDGERTVWCTVCNAFVTEKIDKLEATTMNIQVYNDKGEPASYATVELFYTVTEKNKDKEVKYTVDDYAYVTGADGKITIAVPVDFEGWRARVYYNGGSHYSDELVPGDEFNVIGMKAEEPEEEEEPADEKEAHTRNCTCSCHKKGPVGFFFRLFKRLSFKYAGELSCCTAPETKLFLNFFSF